MLFGRSLAGTRSICECPKCALTEGGSGVHTRNRSEFFDEHIELENLITTAINSLRKNFVNRVCSGLFAV
jgi:hypothetical protein